MTKVVKLLSHELTPEQTKQLNNRMKISKILTPPDNLMKRWSDIPPDMNEEELKEYLIPIKDYLFYNTEPQDYVIVQGESGAVFHIVSYLKHANRIPIYATTKREVKEVQENGRTIKKSIFKHCRFRRY